MSTFFINGKTTLINGPRNPPFWFITFSAVPFNEIHPLSKYLLSHYIFVLNIDPAKLPTNLSCPILGSWVFDNFILSDELLAKAWKIFKTCVSVNNNLCGTLVWALESQITFYERFKVTTVLFFITDFTLLSCESDNFTFKVLYWAILYWYYIKAKLIYNTLILPCEISRVVSFAPSVRKRLLLLYPDFQ